MAFDFTTHFILWGGVLALLCVFASILSRRLGAPLLLMFLVLGMLAGEDGPGGIRFNDFNLAFLLGNLALAIIILDGGLGTRKDTFRVSLKPALSLATIGVVLTAGITAFVARWVLDLNWLEAFLIGAIVGSTDAAAVFGLLRFAGLDLKERTGASLEIESGTNDPMAIFLTVTLVQMLATNEDQLGVAMVLEFVQQMGLGLILGIAGGFLLVAMLRNMSVPASLYPLMALAGGLSIFGITNLLGGSGFLAIYITGLIAGNSSLPYSGDIHRFHDGVAWLSQIGMFLMLGLLITPSHLPPIIIPATGIALALIFVARPLAVVISLLPFQFPWREQLFISWCGLRGAVPIILALFPSLAGLEKTSTIFELVFFVVLISLLLQGWTIAPVAKWLKIDIPSTLKLPDQLVFKIQDDHAKELQLYRVIEDSSAIGAQTRRLPLHEGAELVAVIRNGILVPDPKRQNLQLNDRVLILASADFASDSLLRLFAPKAIAQHSNPSAFFGDFVIRPDAGLHDLAQLYGFPLPDDLKDVTVGDYFDRKFHHKPVIGDRLAIGHVQLVVKALEGDAVSAVGLKFTADPV